MIVKAIINEDFNDYKKPSMFIATPCCTFKCDKECGKQICQNSELAKAPSKIVDDKEIIKSYLSNNLTQAIVFGGLEPFDTIAELVGFIADFRKQCSDDIVIYTGYTESELKETILGLREYSNIIVKFGRYIHGQKGHFDEILGVNLASDNQYAKIISGDDV